MEGNSQGLISTANDSGLSIVSKYFGNQLPKIGLCIQCCRVISQLWRLDCFAWFAGAGHGTGPVEYRTVSLFH